MVRSPPVPIGACHPLMAIIIAIGHALRAPKVASMPAARGRETRARVVCRRPLWHNRLATLYSAMLNETLLAALGEILPPSALLTAGEDTRPYECDGLTLFRAQPLAVLLPENESQVVEILKICNAARLPVVARGAGTGLSGGATPN